MSGEAPVYTETLNIREDPRILKVVDEIAKQEGTDRTALYRTAIRFWLRDERKQDIAKIIAVPLNL